MRPDPPGRPELRDFFEEIDMGIEKEGELGSERVDVEMARESEFDISETVREGVGELLHSGRAGFPDVVTRDRQRLVVGHLLRAELHQVADEPKVRLRREQPLLLRHVLLEDVGLQGAVQLSVRNALTFCRDHIHAEDRDGGTADRHRRGDVAKGNVFEQQLHVGCRVDRDAAVTHLTTCLRVIGIATHQSGHVERDRQASTSGVQNHPVPLVGLRRVAEPGELPDRPRTTPIPAAVETPGERIFAGPTDAGGTRILATVGRSVRGLEGQAAQREPRPVRAIPSVHAALQPSPPSIVGRPNTLRCELLRGEVAGVQSQRAQDRDHIVARRLG